MGTESELKTGKRSQGLAFGEYRSVVLLQAHCLPHFGNDHGLCGSERINWFLFVKPDHLMGRLTFRYFLITCLLTRWLRGQGHLLTSFLSKAEGRASWAPPPQGDSAPEAVLTAHVHAWLLCGWHRVKGLSSTKVPNVDTEGGP